MGVERVDYSSDDEYQQAVESEGVQWQQWEDRAQEEQHMQQLELSRKAVLEAPERPWCKFDGEHYVKAFYDVLLPDGTIVKEIWPNAGVLDNGRYRFTATSNILVRIGKLHPMSTLEEPVLQEPYDADDAEWWKECDFHTALTSADSQIWFGEY